MRNCGPATTPACDDELRQVAGYPLLRRVGEGGMSRVYLSYDIAAGNSVAVKLLADHLSHSPEFVGRFYREARLSRLLLHRNLVRGVGAGFDPVAGKHYLILEFIDGPTAQTVLSRLSGFPVGVAVRVGIDLSHALAFLHSRQYVHRDVKPDNILLHPDGIAKLADLGLAKRLNDDPNITSTHLGVGTSYYMAYEQALNADLVDGRSDIFALGATLYHLLTGQVPFAGPTHEDVMRGKERNASRPIRELNPEVPPALAEIITKTLACNPRERIQTAAELAAALEATSLARPIPCFSSSGQAESVGAQLETPTRADLPSTNGGSADALGNSSADSRTSAGPPAPGLASNRRPVVRFPFRTVLPVLASVALTVVLSAATGFVAIPTSWKTASQLPPDDGHLEESPPSTDGLNPTLSQ